MRRQTATRWLLAWTFVLAHLLALVPAAAAQTPSRLLATWDPPKLTGALLACPEQGDPQANCPVERGVTYQTSVRVALDGPSDALIIGVDGGGLDIVATSRATGVDLIPPLTAGQETTVDLTVTIPEADARNERSFYIGRVTLQGTTPVAGSMLISVVVPKPRISWGRLLDPATGDKAPLETFVGSGQIVTRQVDVTSSLDLSELRVRSNSDRATITGVGGDLQAGVTETATLQFRAPIVNRRTKAEILFIPVNGLQALSSTLRMRVTILPVELRWSVAQVRESLKVQSQVAKPVTVRVVSNYDVDNVRFKTADLGLTPIVAPLNPVNLRAGVPQEVRFNMCPGYAPTTYFLGITAYQGAKPLNRRLPIRMLVDDDSTPWAPPAKDPCAQ